MHNELEQPLRMVEKGSAASNDGQKAWAPLRLIDYGSVQHLTQGSGSGNEDAYAGRNDGNPGRG